MPSNWTEEYKHPIDYLCQETGVSSTDILLMENSDLIVLEQTGDSESLWTLTTKN